MPPVLTSPPSDRFLVADVDRNWTPDEVWGLANRVAHLARMTCGDHRRLAVFAENAGEAVIAHLGGLRSGVSVVAMSAHLNAADAAYMLEVADVAMVVAGPRTAAIARQAADEVTKGGRPCRVLEWGTPEWETALSDVPASPPADDRPIRPNLLFTSGTTGRPKATELPPNVFPRAHSWAGFLEAVSVNRFVGLGPHLVVAPLHHTGPLNAVRALAVGTPVVVLDRFDPAATLAAIERWNIGSTTLVPTHLARLLALPSEVRRRADVSSISLVFQTGSACPIDVKRQMIEWWGPVFLEAYGATEVGVTTSITSTDWLDHPGSVGRSVAPYQALVVDDAGQPLPPGEEGRLYFRDTTGRGIVYHDDPARSAAAHLAPGVFTLGEIGRVDQDGWVYITDRFADMVVTGGVNVYPAELEQVLVAHPSVADVAGIGLPHPDLGEQMVALVVPTRADDGTATAIDLAELQAWCEARLSRYKCPRQIRVVTSLGRNALGKLDKRTLRAGHADPALGQIP